MKKITNPTKLTICRFVLIIPLVAFYLIDTSWAKWAVLFVFVIGAVSDKIDGFWARKTQQVTDVGAFLDPIADKILVDSILVCFCYARDWFVIAVVIILLRDLLVDGMRMVAARQRQTIAASKLGKAKTATQMTAIAFLLLGRATALVTDGVLGIISNIAWGCGTILFMGSLCLVVISGWDYLSKGWKQLF